MNNFNSVREIEKQIEKAEKDNAQIDPGMDKPYGVPNGFAEPAVKQAVERDMEDGNRAGVDATPTVFIDGQYNGGLALDASQAGNRGGTETRGWKARGKRQ